MPLCKWHTFSMAPCLACYFIVILFYNERRWLLMRNLAKILPLKSKSYYVSGAKIFWRRCTKIYRHCISSSSRMQFLGVKKWCSANVFSDTKQKYVCWKVYFLLFLMTSELRFVKSLTFFEWNYAVKQWVIFFASVCWLGDFLLETPKLKNVPDNVHCNLWTNIKKLHDWNDIFKERIPNMRFCIIYILVQISFFRGLL